MGSSTSSVYTKKALAILWRVLAVRLVYLAGPQVNVEVDELRILLYKIADGINFEEITSLFLHVETDLRASLQGVSSRILDNTERAGIRFPDVLLVVVVFGRHHNPVRN